MVCVLAGGCFGQAPRDVAWEAYTIGANGRYDQIPRLIQLVEEFHGGGVEDKGRMPPDEAVMEVVADALIRLKAKLPADVAMHLYPRFPAQTIILLSRASDNAGPLMEIFQKTKSRDLWLAAGNLLAAQPPAGFARALLAGAITTFAFRVVWTDSVGDSGRGGCAGDSMMRPDEEFRDWPRARVYRIIHSRGGEIFAPGIHPVGFVSWPTTDYLDSWDDGDCSEWTSAWWRTGLLAQLQGKTLRDFPLAPRVEETVVYTSDEAFEDRVRSAIEKKARAFHDVVAALEVENAGDLHLQCRIEVMDERPQPRVELPQVEGRWCAAPPDEANLRLP
jgi:hypothetical protein